LQWSEKDIILVQEFYSVENLTNSSVVSFRLIVMAVTFVRWAANPLELGLKTSFVTALLGDFALKKRACRTEDNEPGLTPE